MILIQRWKFLMVYALRSLRREGIRTVLAMLSIMFGVLSLVSMQELSSSLLGTIFDERVQYGGDAQISPPDKSRTFTTTELAQIETWRQQGLIKRYTPLANGGARYLRTPDSGRVTFLYGMTGFDPSSYPLVGSLSLREPANASPANLLRNPTDALITRDLADSLGLKIGDTFLLGGGGVAPLKMTIAGIVQATPDLTGKGVYYTLATAQLIENRADVVTAISVLWGDVPNAVQTITKSSFDVRLSRSHDEVLRESESAAFFDVMLKAAGVLGLLVGGLGVSNTLQVILARRKLEIAMLKTLGCRHRTILLMIGLEMGLLGLISSLIGAVVGAALGGIFLDILGGAGTFLLNWSPNMGIAAGGILAGTSTAVVFGLQAILASSATRPIELLRDLPHKPALRDVAGRGVLFGLLIVVFGALVGLVLGSVVEGIAYVFTGGIVLTILRAIFWLVLWAVLKLPLPRLPMLRMARANLRRRKVQSSLVVMALFAGVFSITFAALVINTARSTVMGRRPSDGGYNVIIYTDANGASLASERARAQNALSVYTRYQINGTLNGNPIAIEGRVSAELAADIIFAGTWNESDQTALLSTAYKGAYQIGDKLTLTATGTVEVEIAGFYEIAGTYNADLGNLPKGIIVTPKTALALGGARTLVSVLASVPIEQLNAVTEILGRSLPNALVISKADLSNWLIANFQVLFSFSVSIAGLAFIAGAVLIANAAGLSVVERRREIGVFKAVGYTSGHVMRLFVGEYGLLGLLAGIFGLIAVIVTITLLNSTQRGVPIVIDPGITGVMLVLSIVIAISSAALVTWQPTHVRPLDVLRYE